MRYQLRKDKPRARLETESCLRSGIRLTIQITTFGGRMLASDTKIRNKLQVVVEWLRICIAFTSTLSIHTTRYSKEIARKWEIVKRKLHHNLFFFFISTIICWFTWMANPLGCQGLTVLLGICETLTTILWEYECIKIKYINTRFYVVHPTRVLGCIRSRCSSLLWITTQVVTSELS